MGSTGEPDRKRRHLSSISSPSPTAAATMARKQPFSLSSEDKKLDAAVLQFQNKKLSQKIEVHKDELVALKNKFSQMSEKQLSYDSALKAVDNSLEVLLTGLETSAARTRELSSRQEIRHLSIRKDASSSPVQDAFLSRIMETGATQSSTAAECPSEMEEGRGGASDRLMNILPNIVAAISDLWYLKDALYGAVLKELPEGSACRQKESSEIEMEIKNLKPAISELHLRHKSVARELQNCQDIDAKNKAELRRLRGELKNAVAELEESKCKLAFLKSERDAKKGALFPVLNLGSKHVAGDKIRDKQKDLQEMEYALKDLSDQASSRLRELKRLHEERLRMLQQLSDLQNSFKNVKYICSSQAYLLAVDQLEKSKSEVFQYQALFEKLQVEKDNLLWREREVNMKNDIVDVFRRSFAFKECRIADLGRDIHKQINERTVIETRLEAASREPGRKEIIAEFKALVSSFPEEMSSMQRQLSNYKEASSDIHSLRADEQSYSNSLDRKVTACESLSSRSTNQVAEIQRLQFLEQDSKESDVELELILEMYKRESTDPRDVVEAKDMEYKAWAQVHSLKSSLDEQNLELRVKTANEAEAISQQKLAAAEAEIADLRQKLEASKREMSRLADVLKSKNEETEAYLSEIETIGQAYDDMQTQNQHLLQQITERDDYNIKLVLEGVRSRQLLASIHMDRETMEKEIREANFCHDFFNAKAIRIEDQLKVCSDQVNRLSEQKLHTSVVLENTQKRLLDVRRSSNQARQSLEESQSKVEMNRAALLELQVEIEKERFDKRRIEEHTETMRTKISSLQSLTEGSSVVEKLQQELTEYREIVKCSICHDRPKEVVITKCYHLFCNSCIQRITESRHRKCPRCTASFGPNDVKPVYI